MSLKPSRNIGLSWSPDDNNGKFPVYRPQSRNNVTKPESIKHELDDIVPEENISFGLESYRNTKTATEGLTRDELRESLKSQNPLRNNIPYSSEDLLFLEYVEKYSLNSGLVRIFNETMESIAEFFRLAIDAGGLKGRFKPGEKVEIKVKYTKEGRSDEYSDISNHLPREFIKNREVHQYLVFLHAPGQGQKEIVTVPFMIGCKWCKTSRMTPQELHEAGENALNYSGYFIIEGTPRFFLAHEKIAHNAINVIKNEDTGTYITSLKIKDEFNNSVENFITKGKRDKGSRRTDGEDTYFLSTACFANPIETNKIFKQIYDFIIEITNETNLPLQFGSYAEFIEYLIQITAGPNLRHYIIYETTATDDDQIVKPPNINYEQALTALYRKKERMQTYRKMFLTLNSAEKYPEMVIASIFPSIATEQEEEIETNKRGYHNKPRINKEEEKRKKALKKYDILFSKALLLMKMIVSNVLTENNVISPTNRNHVGNKAYMNVAEIFRRDLTRDEGDSIGDIKNYYKPKASVAKGEADVSEVLEFNNHFNVRSSETSLSIPRCTHSKDPEIRGTNASHTGNVCPNDTPSNAMVGLNTKLALTASFSVQKNIFDIHRIVSDVLGLDNSTLGRFPIGEEDNKLLSINSVPFALINHRRFKAIRKVFKRDFRLMDCPIIEESYIVKDHKNGIDTRFISSYNIICDGGRIYRPLYNVEQLRALELDYRQKIQDDLEIKEYDFLAPLINLNVPVGKLGGAGMNLFKGICGDTPLSQINNEALFENFVETLSPESAWDLDLFQFQDFLEDYIKDKKIEHLIKEGIIEMVFPSEMEFYKIAYDKSQLSSMYGTVIRSDESVISAESASEMGKINGFIDYRYCEINPVAIYGYTASCAPMINHNPGPRANHEPAMAKSCLTPITTNQGFFIDSSAKVLHSSTPAAVTTKTNELASRHINNGVSAVFAICTKEGNLEDAFTANKRFTDRVVIERIHTIEIAVEEGEYMGIAPGTVYRKERYHNIDENSGLPKIGIARKVGDFIVAKYRLEPNLDDPNAEPNPINKSVQIETGKDGYVQEIRELVIDKTKVYRITISSFRTLQKGDKLATRYSQKGVIGDIIPHNLMPYVKNGKNKRLVPDLIYSPLSVTSRATPALILELLCGTYAAATGNQVDGTAFVITLEMVNEYNKILVGLGYEPWGEEMYVDPASGQEVKMMTGIAYVRVLKHTSNEKQKASGLVNFLSVSKENRQPSKGGPTGAVRSGYMDFFTQAAHGIPHFMTRLFRDQSDRVFIDICAQCGHFCDRCNRDPDTARDTYASKYCTKCHEASIVTAESCWALVIIYYHLLSVNIKMSMFPSIE
jgi:DNA-directed RNA polymerase subunit B'